MNKEEIIAKYGEGAYEKMLEQRREYHKGHREEENARSMKYREEHPEELATYNKRWREEHLEYVKAYQKMYYEENQEREKARSREQSRKGGKNYEHMLEYLRTGIPGERRRIRSKHAREYRPYKMIIAPESQIHHEWMPDTSEYRGVALVEKEAHMHGFVDVIEILDGEITLLTEEEVKRGEKRGA